MLRETSKSWRYERGTIQQEQEQSHCQSVVWQGGVQGDKCLNLSVLSASDLLLPISQTQWEAKRQGVQLTLAVQISISGQSTVEGGGWFWRGKRRIFSKEANSFYFFILSSFEIWTYLNVSTVYLKKFWLFASLYTWMTLNGYSQLKKLGLKFSFLSIRSCLY